MRNTDRILIFTLVCIVAMSAVCCKPNVSEKEGVKSSRKIIVTPGKQAEITPPSEGPPYHAKSIAGVFLGMTEPEVKKALGAPKEEFHGRESYVMDIEAGCTMVYDPSIYYAYYDVPLSDRGYTGPLNISMLPTGEVYSVAWHYEADNLAEEFHYLSAYLCFYFGDDYQEIIETDDNEYTKLKLLWEEGGSACSIWHKGDYIFVNFFDDTLYQERSRCDRE